MDGTAALSELVESFRGDEEKQIVREEFEKVLSQYVNGPRATQQVAQLWDKVSRSRDVRTRIELRFSCAVAGQRGPRSDWAGSGVFVPATGDATEGVSG